jgi:hypothetical protein
MPYPPYDPNRPQFGPQGMPPTPGGPPMPPMPGGTPPGGNPADGPFGLSPDDPRVKIMMMQMQQAGYAPEQNNLGRQMKMADELRGTAGPQARSSGGVTTAAHPLEFVSTLANRAVGMNKAADTEARELDLQRRRLQSMSDFMRPQTPIAPGME